MEFQSINISNTAPIKQNIETIRNMEVSENWSLKEKDMHVLAVNGKEIFSGIVRTKHPDFPYILFVDVMNSGDVFWYNTKKYEERIIDNKIELKLKNCDNWVTVCKDNKFIPHYGRYLLNGYSYVGKDYLRYPAVKFNRIGRPTFIPRVHQLVSLFGFGIETFKCLGKNRTLEINHMNPIIKDEKIQTQGLGQLEIITIQGNREHRDMYRYRNILIKKHGKIVFNI